MEKADDETDSLQLLRSQRKSKKRKMHSNSILANELRKKTTSLMWDSE